MKSVVAILFLILFVGNIVGKKKIRLALVGDSTGFRVTKELVELLNCALHDNENPVNGREPNINYFSQGGKISGIIAHTRDCGGCQSRRGTCRSRLVSALEYLTMEYVMDTELATSRTSWGGLCSGHPGDVYCEQSPTTQEFVFGEWWTSSRNTCPDVIFHLATNVHDIARRSTVGYRRSVTWMFGVIAEFLDVSCPDTKYYWSTAARVEEAKVPKEYRNVTKNEKIVEFNQIALNSFPKHERMFLGFDQYNYSLLLDISRYTDAVHLSKSTYHDMGKKFLQIAELLE